MTFDCNALISQIQAEFNKIKQAAAPTGNITDEMVMKTSFNSLVELAKKHCGTIYTKEWQSGGYILVAKPYP